MTDPLPSDKCQANVRNGWHVYHCGKKAKMQHTDGRCYCGLHDPIRLKAKADERSTEHQAELDRKNKEYADREKLISDGRKYAMMWPILAQILNDGYIYGDQTAAIKKIMEDK